MNEQHIIELSNRYQITIIDNGFILYQLVLTKNGSWKRAKAQHCKNFSAVLDSLEHCELAEEDVATLQDCLKVREAIAAEIREVICKSQSY